MKKNVASQKIGAQMVTAADGTAFTGSVTVSVTGDAGTQATGSVGSGACAHEGNGYHTYAPAQGETNYDLVAFTFTGTGAIPATVQVFTSFPQTADAPTAAAVADAVWDEATTSHTTSGTFGEQCKTDIDAILADTNELQTDWVNGGRLDVLIDAVKAKTDSLTYTVAGVLDANIQYVNDIAVTGDGQSGTEWGPA